MSNILLRYEVRVYIDTAITDESIKMVSGVCTWGVGDGILSQTWIRGIGNSVDIRVSGKYATYNNPKLSIINSANVEQILNSHGLSIKGARVEIAEINDANEILLFRGAIEKPIDRGNDTTLPCSHVANYYSTNITPMVGENYSPVTFGESVDNVLMTYVEGPRSDDTTIGDGLIPVFSVLNQYSDGSQIDLLSLYDEDTVTHSDMTDFLSNNTFCIAEGENPLALELKNVFLHQGESYGVTCKILPMNIRTSDGEPYLPDGSNCVLGHAEYDKYYTPYGSVPDYDKITFKSGNVFLPFPSYIDSRVDYSDRMEVLDVDSSGVSYVSPAGKAGTSIPSAIPLSVFDPSGYTYRGDGVWDNGILESGVYEVSNNDNYSSRGDSTSREINISGSLDLEGAGHSPYIIQAITQYSVKYGRSFPDDSYFTSEDNVQIVYNVDPYGMIITTTTVVYLTTIKDTYEVDTAYSFTQSSSCDHYVIDNKLPDEVSDNSVNKRYRWENRSDILGESISLFVSSLEDYEKAAPMTVHIKRISNIDSSEIRSGSFTYLSSEKTYITRADSYDRGDLYMSGVEGRDDINDIPITNTLDAYRNILALQNYKLFGFAPPALGWGLDYITENLSNIVDSGASMLSIPLAWSTSDTDTKTLKYELLKMTQSIGYLDDLGRETVSSALDMYNLGGYPITRKKLGKGNDPVFTPLDPKYVYAEYGVSYNDGKINISNVEQPTYKSEYVTGVDNSDDSRVLWEAGHLLYEIYGVKTKMRKALGQVEGIKNKTDAVQYIKNQYALAGCVFSETTVLVKKRYEMSVNLPLSIVWDCITTTGHCQIGTLLNVTMMGRTDDTGIITSISPDPIGGDCGIKVQCVGDVVGQSEFTIITETGTASTVYTETGTATEIITEEI
ncbi:MAG: hypothetical protein GY774_00275 [Planctomycetes bacterium]|nr:hypothetical protein [Planctomycetota bacterium]